MAFVKRSCKTKTALFGKAPDTEECFGTAPRSCSICGRPPSAFWTGEKIIGVCTACAVQVLPVLIADAVAVESAGQSCIPAMRLARVETNYWRALALALARLNGHDVELLN